MLAIIGNGFIIGACLVFAAVGVAVGMGREDC